MPRKKPYEDGCAAAHALDLVGERWSLLIVRELMLGAQRFTDLKGSLHGVSTNILTNRLVELEDVGVIQRRTLPPPVAHQVYELSPWGLELEPIIKDLGRWAARSPRLPRGKPMSAASLMLSLRTMFSPERAGDTRLEVGLVLDDVPHRLSIENETVIAERGEAKAPDVILSAGPTLLVALLYGGLPVAEAIRAGLKIAGDRRAIGRLRKLFPLPSTYSG